jgi:DNA-binding transcriptional MerR regulator
MRRLDEETVKKILRLRKIGLSYKKIAEIVGINWQTVMYYCNPASRKSANQRAREYLKRHREEVNKRRREWRKRNKIKYYLSVLKSTIKKLPKEKIEELKEIVESKEQKN